MEYHADLTAAHLHTERLTPSFGRLLAVSAVDLDVAPGELAPTGGRVFLDGEDITHARAAHGVRVTFR